MLRDQLARLKFGRKSKPNLSVDAIGRIYVFIRSWNRPLYLWSCLDSLFRNTAFDCRFVLIDNASPDPLVRSVVNGFARRSMFHAVHFMDHNTAASQNMVFFRYREELGSYFLLLDSDILVEPSDPCWLTRLLSIAENRPDLGVIGSAVDTNDFVNPESARALHPDLPDAVLADLIKSQSPERTLSMDGPEIVHPFYPPGRLLLLRTEVFRDQGLQIGNARICRAALQKGFGNGIASTVRHRHLSLMNIYDYPEYDYRQLREYLRAG